MMTLLIEGFCRMLASSAVTFNLMGAAERANAPPRTTKNETKPNALAFLLFINRPFIRPEL
jgi:hypothetical protein